MATTGGVAPSTVTATPGLEILSGARLLVGGNVVVVVGIVVVWD